MMEEVINEILAAEAEAAKIRAAADEKAERTVLDAETHAAATAKATESKLKARRAIAKEEAEKRAEKQTADIISEAEASAAALKDSYRASIKKESKKAFWRIINGDL